MRVGGSSDAGSIACADRRASLCCSPARAVRASGLAACIEGVVTTQGGTIRLGGAQVVLHDSVEPGNRDGAVGGRRPLPLHRAAGRQLRVTASLDGLRDRARGGRRRRRRDDGAIASILPLATLTQTVEVMAPASIVSAADTLGSAESISSRETDEFASGSGLGGALRLLASVIEVPGGVSIKGGRPTQAGVQIGASTLTDPVLGLVHFTLPDDAIDSVAVMPNPYAVEYGRFSSGLVVIQTRRAGDVVARQAQQPDPDASAASATRTFTTSTASPAGRRNFEMGGPIVKNRVFLEQTAQYRYSSDDVPSRPEDERRTTHWFSSFTRVDANLTPKHSLVGDRRFLPERHARWRRSARSRRPTRRSTCTSASMLGTVTERALWSDSARVASPPSRSAAIRRRCSRRAPRRCSCCPKRRSATSSTRSTDRRPRFSSIQTRLGIGEAAVGAAPVQGRPRSAASTTTTARATAVRS